MVKRIDSLKNPLVKQILQLREKSRVRKKTGLFVLEGYREFTLAMAGGYVTETVLFQPEIITPEAVYHLLEDTASKAVVVEISEAVYRKLAYRETTEGIMAISRTKEHKLSDLVFGKAHPLFLIAEAPEKPGNIGALLRTADAAAVDAVIIANPKTDVYNPNIIRSSVGTLFTSQIAMGEATAVIAFLKEKNIAIYSAVLVPDAIPYHKVDFTTAAAVVVGTENSGLSDIWLRHCTSRIHIPMQGKIDSLNVSVSAAILIFEAKRQRGLL